MTVQFDAPGGKRNGNGYGYKPPPAVDELAAIHAEIGALRAEESALRQLADAAARAQARSEEHSS